MENAPEDMSSWSSAAALLAERVCEVRSVVITESNIFEGYSLEEPSYRFQVRKVAWCTSKDGCHKIYS